MKVVSALTAIVFATGLIAANSAFALGSAIVVAPSGPAAEAEGASAAAQSRTTSKDNSHTQATQTKNNQPPHRSAANGASGAAANLRQTQ